MYRPPSNSPRTEITPFDRLDETVDSPAEPREALYGELSGRVAGPEEYDAERSVEELVEDVDRARGGE